MSDQRVAKDDDMRDGSVRAFDKSWKTQKQEALQNYFVTGRAHNQIQFSFQNQWQVYRSFVRNPEGGRCLEVGCGRGSISCYFADHGFAAHLLDTSHEVLGVARRILDLNQLQGLYIAGNALNLPFDNNVFDVVVSVGLLEHFEDIYQPIKEQVRVLKPDGVFLANIVPEKWSVQTLARPLNAILGFLARSISRLAARPQTRKPKLSLFRTGAPSSAYTSVLRDLGMERIFTAGMFPVPAISHSPEFPFTLLPSPVESTLVAVWHGVIWMRSLMNRQHGWLCHESWGQHLLVVASKPSKGALLL